MGEKTRGQIWDRRLEGCIEGEGREGHETVRRTQRAAAVKKARESHGQELKRERMTAAPPQ